MRENCQGKVKLLSQRESIDSGVDVTHDGPDGDSGATQDDRERLEQTSLSAEDEIRNFMENKDLYRCHPASEEQERFDEFLYYYKSFHSPLLDKEFQGFSMEQIKSESKKIEKLKKEQAKKKMISECLQTLKSKTALRAWREKYRQLQRAGQRRREEGDVEDCPVSTPYDCDPDWTVANSQLAEHVFHPAPRTAMRLADLDSAVAVLSDELDLQVDNVIKASGRPGGQGEQARQRRSARIDRLTHKLETVRSKVRSLSAHHLSGSG